MKLKSLLFFLLLVSAAVITGRAGDNAGTNDELCAALNKLLAGTKTADLNSLIDADALKAKKWQEARLPEDTSIKYHIIKSNYQVPNSILCAVGEQDGKRGFHAILAEAKTFQEAKAMAEDYKKRLTDCGKVVLTSSGDFGRANYFGYVFGLASDVNEGKNQAKITLVAFLNQYNNVYYIKMVVYADE